MQSDEIGVKFTDLQDSGSREEFSTGSVRDNGEGKGWFHLIPMLPLERLAQHYENGARKYEKDNWKKGQPLSRYYDSAMRHLLKWKEGWTDEDHLSAAMWNIAALVWTENEIREGRLPEELNDISV